MYWFPEVIRKFTTRFTRESGLRLDMGERAVNFPSEEFDKFLHSLTQEDFICYPSEDDYDSLKERIAALEGVSSSHLSLSFGSDQAIKNIFDLCSQPGMGLIINDPSFPMYKVYADMFKLKCVTVGYEPSLDFNLTNMLERFSSNTAFAILTNPNSPFGAIKPLEDIAFLCKELEDRDAALLVDEAYIDFGGESAVSLIDTYDNLFVCKTFSKAWGAAGARCGYIISSPFNILQLEKIRPSFPLTGPTLKYLSFLLQNPLLKERYLNQVLEEKNKIKNNKDSRFSIKYGNVSWIHINDKEDNFYLDKLLSKHKISYKNGLSLPYDKRTNWIRLGLTEGISNLISK
tara:strand:- start:3453 stop:4487 length:1035 start_codon:yes stop_codon:yes gene_type:complete